MNQAATAGYFGTSGTFSGSSILYYHLSRALDTEVTVPPAVLRTMDKDQHHERVTLKANPPANAKMNVAGWHWLDVGESNPVGYNRQADLFTKDHTQIYGALVKGKGERYGFEINGTRESGWGKGQNFDFQKTPAFSALKSSATDLRTAILDGYQKAIRNPLMAKAVPSAPTEQQMVLWMNELSEIAILDYIFSQQDRVGNVDYSWYWSYVDDKGEVQAEAVKDANYKSKTRVDMAKILVPKELAGKNAQLIQKTSISDNDAGGLVEYANFTKATGMLDGVVGQSEPLRHLNKETYQRLLKLAQDFKLKAANFQVLNSESRMMGYTDAGDRRFNQLIGNTISAANILEKNCRAGVLKLDLVSFKKAMKNDFASDETSCDIQE